LIFIWPKVISGQNTVWSEDFSSYQEDTGIDGTGNIGDYPANVTKWSLDVSGCSLSNEYDYIKTDNQRLKTQDVDGDAIWQSESIDISSFTNGVNFSIKFYEYDDMEDDDYIDVYYQLDGGSFTLITNWNGHGSDEHTLTGDFSSDTVVQSISLGSSLVIKVVQNCDSGSEELQMDDVFVFANMIYVSSTTSQYTKKVGKGLVNRQIIGIEIETEYSENPLNVSQFTVNANGSTTPVSNNIENAKIFYTGLADEFSTDSQFGTTYSNPTTTNFNITGSRQLQSGINYFWVTFDIKTTATNNDVVDAECISLIIEGNNTAPSITAPTGNRIIADALSGNYTIGSGGDYITIIDAVNDLNELGISGTTVFDIAAATYTEQIQLNTISGTSSSDSIVFRSPTSDRQDVIINYLPTDNKNYVLNINGSDNISFENLSFESISGNSYGTVLFVEGQTSDLNFLNCNFKGLAATSAGDNMTVVFLEDGENNMANNIVFDNDSILSGSNSIYFAGGNDTDLESGNIIQNCFFNDFYSIGLEISFQENIVIENNNFSSSASGSAKKGIVCTYCNNASQITRNRIILNASDQNTGLSLINCYAGSGTESLIANNFISLQQALIETVGLQIINSGYQQIIHNTINIHSSKKGNNSRTGDQSGLSILHYWQDVLFSCIKIINNIISSNAKALMFSQTTADNSYVEESNNNDLHTEGSVLGTHGSTDCTNLGEWQTASGQDANSVSEDPQFQSNAEPLIDNDNLNESVPRVADVQTDINDNVRQTTTAPGAVKGTLCVWEGLCNTDWNDPCNWKNNHVPGSNDRVYIPSDTYYNPQLNGNAQIGELTINGQGETAQLHLNGNTLSVSGDYNCIDGLVTNGTIELNGGEDQNLQTDPENQNATYWNVNINKTNPDTDVTLRKELPVNNITVQTGNLDANNKKIEVSGNADFSGGSVTNTSEVEFLASEVVNFNPGSNTLGNLTFSGGGTYNQLSDLVCQGNFTVNGTYNSNNKNVDFPVPTILDLKNAVANSQFKKIELNEGPSEIGLVIGLVFERLVIAAASGKSNDEFIIDGPLTVDTLTVGNEGSSGNSLLKILPSSSIEINNNLSISSSGSITLMSSDSTTGSLINHIDASGTGSNNIKIERYLSPDQWHLLAAPVNGSITQDLYFNGNPDVWLKKYNENTDDWTYITSLSEPLLPGKGFAIWVENTNATVEFEGGIRAIDLTLDNSTFPALEFTDEFHGYNLVGNPFTAAIDWDEGTWQRSGLEGSVWVWEDAGNGDGSGNYLTRNLAGEGSLTGGIIPLNQGFFVRATTSSPELTIPEDARVASQQQYYKTSNRDLAPHVVLNVTGNNKKDEVWVGFDEQAGNGIDYGRDAGKNFGINSPQLWLVEDETALSIDILCALENNVVTSVQLNFKACFSGLHEIYLSENTLDNVCITLEDLETGKIHILTEDPFYLFSANTNSNPERFRLHFQKLTTDIENQVSENNDVQIHSAGNQIVIIDNDENPAEERSMIIYDLQGRTLCHSVLSNAKVNYVKCSTTGLLLISYTKGSYIINKLILNK
jgi:hypothetical protein